MDAWHSNFVHIIGYSHLCPADRRPDQQGYLVLFHQFPGFVDGHLGIGTIIFDDDLYLPADDLHTGFFKCQLCTFDHPLSGYRHMAGERT